MNEPHEDIFMRVHMAVMKATDNAAVNPDHDDEICGRFMTIFDVAGESSTEALMRLSRDLR